MALLERVATLVRANLNDIIDKAEEPEKMIKQVILDMQNQLLQVKTQVAIAIADQHLLEKKQKENQEKSADWVRKAELAVDKKEDDLARAAIERSLSYRSLAENFGEQVADQTVQVENLKSALRKLEQKLAEAQAKSDVLIAQHRRARALNKAGDARLAMGSASNAEAFDRMKGKVQRDEALSQAKAELTGESIEDRLASLEKEEEVSRLLAGLKASGARRRAATRCPSVPPDPCECRTDPACASQCDPPSLRAIADDCRTPARAAGSPRPCATASACSPDGFRSGAFRAPAEPACAALSEQRRRRDEPGVRPDRSQWRQRPHATGRNHHAGRDEGAAGNRRSLIGGGIRVRGHLPHVIQCVRSFFRQRVSAPFADNQVRLHARSLQGFQQPDAENRARGAGDADHQACWLRFVHFKFSGR